MVNLIRCGVYKGRAWLSLTFCQAQFCVAIEQTSTSGALREIAWCIGRFSINLSADTTGQGWMHTTLINDSGALSKSAVLAAQNASMNFQVSPD